MILAALTLLGERSKVWRLLLAGLGLATIHFLARTCLLHLGLHTPIILIGLIVALTFGFRLSINLAVTGCFLSFFLLLLGESQVAVPIMHHMGFTYQDTLTNPWLGVALGWISASLLVLTIVVCRLTGFVLVKSAKKPNTVD